MSTSVGAGNPRQNSGGGANVEACSICGQAVGPWYFRVNHAMSCLNCARAAKHAASGDSGGAFARALLFGASAAIVGLILYAAFGILTGLIAGYLSLGVGYLVGKAMMMGARGVGGRRYQVAAVLLTYASVAMAAVPIQVGRGVRQYRAQTQMRRPMSEVPADRKMANSAEADQRLRQEFGGAAVRPFPPRPGARNSPAGTANQGPAVDGGAPSAHLPSSGGVRPAENVAAALAYLTVMGLASPLLELQEPVSGVIGLIILMIGIRIAWQLTAAKRVEIMGPFQSVTG
jgi:hypothetical protein